MITDVNCCVIKVHQYRCFAFLECFQTTLFPFIRTKTHPINKLIRFQREDSGFVWDADNSKTYCSEYMKQSPVYSLCWEVPNARPEEAIDNCALDLQVSLRIRNLILFIYTPTIVFSNRLSKPGVISLP